MTDRLQDPGRPAFSMKPVAVIDREEYNTLLAERDSLSTAYLRQRAVTIVGVFTLAVVASLLGFVGGFWVGQHTNDQSFKAACSRVIDEAVSIARPRATKLVYIQEAAAEPVQNGCH